jgi:hypothetical protein
VCPLVSLSSGGISVSYCGTSPLIVFLLRQRLIDFNIILNAAEVRLVFLLSPLVGACGWPIQHLSLWLVFWESLNQLSPAAGWSDSSFSLWRNTFGIPSQQQQTIRQLLYELPLCALITYRVHIVAKEINACWAREQSRGGVCFIILRSAGGFIADCGTKIERSSEGVKCWMGRASFLCIFARRADAISMNKQSR